MLVQNSVYRNTYLTDGVNKDFYFSFPILEASQVLVQTSLLTDTGTVTTVDPGQYTVIGVGQTTGGHISFTTAPPSGSRLALTLNIPITQLYQYTELDSFPAKSHEDALAKLTLICQQFREQLERAVMLPSTSSESPEDVVQSIYASRDSAAANANTAYEARQAVAIGLNRASSEADRAQSEADRAQMEANRAQNLANIGPATSDKLGFVKIGEGIAVTEGGIISVPPPPEIKLATKYGAGTVIVGAGLDVSGPIEEGQGLPAPGTLSLAAHLNESGEKYGKGDSQFFGHVKLVDDFEQNADATSGISISPKGVKTAFDRLVGIIGEQVITSSRTWVVPETGRYQITAVGGGGNGGAGGKGVSGYNEDRTWELHGGGGGGGGAGERTQITQTLTKNASYVLTVGGVSGASSFGGLLTARGGGGGGNGEPATGWSGEELRGGYGGAGGTSYGSAAGAGSAYTYWGGGSGGSGATSYDGYYGNGGSGGAGGTAGWAAGSYPGSGGSAGRQGCIKIKIVPV